MHFPIYLFRKVSVKNSTIDNSNFKAVLYKYRLGKFDKKNNIKNCKFQKKKLTNFQGMFSCQNIYGINQRPTLNRNTNNIPSYKSKR